MKRRRQRPLSAIPAPPVRFGLSRPATALLFTATAAYAAYRYGVDRQMEVAPNAALTQAINGGLGRKVAASVIGACGTAAVATLAGANAVEGLTLAAAGAGVAHLVDLAVHPAVP